MQVLGIVRAAGFKPLIRPDVRFLKGPKEDIVIVHDLSTDRRFEMYSMECVIAKALNGSRDLEMVSKAVLPHVPWATHDQVEKVVTQIAGMGLLVNVQVERLQKFNSGSIPRIAPPELPSQRAAPKIDAPHLEPIEDRGDYGQEGDELGEDDDFGESTVVGGFQQKIGSEREGALNAHDALPPPTPAVPQFGANPAMPPTVSHAQRSTPPPPVSAPAFPSDADAVDMDGWGTEVKAASDDVDMDGWGTEVAAESEGGGLESLTSELANSAGALSSTLRAPQAEAEAWEKEAVPLRQRKWFKRTLRIGILLLVAGLLTNIPYPIYVTERCVVQPTVRADVRSQIDGIIDEIFVDEGDLVQAGQLLARFDDREVNYELTRARSVVEMLSANVDKLQTGSRPEEIRQAKARVSAARSDVAIARKQLKSAQALYRNKVGSKSALDDAKGEVQVRGQALGEAQAALKLVEAGFRSEEVKVAVAQLGQAEAEIAHLERRLGLLELHAPIAGHILTPKFKERLHEKITTGDVVVEIGDARRVRVEVAVREEDADIVSLGQTMEVKVHSYPERRFKGTVTFIAPTVEEVDGRRSVRVDAEIDNSDGLLLPRMTGYGEIDTGDSTLWDRISRRFVRWVRVRFLI